MIWVLWLIVINSASVLFLKHVSARWVLAAWVANLLTMTALHMHFGFARILGLSHVIWWTPLVVFIWKSRSWRGLPRIASRWLLVLFITDAISLLVDYVDVLRYFL